MTLKNLTDHPQPLLHHLLELRQRLIYSLLGFFAAFVLCYAYAESIFHFLVHPLTILLQEKGHHRLIYTGLTEAFLTYIKVAAFAAAFLSFPVVASQFWLFIAPGLYHQERKVFIPLLIATPVLFIVGAFFAYYVIFPLAYSFFLSFESPGSINQLPIQLEAKINEYLSFVMRLIFSFGVSFELPVLLTLLANVGMISSRGLIEKWRFAIIGIFIIAAVITPPDILSMVGLAIPLIILYGISILMVRSVEHRHLMKLKGDI
ncbi:MAG: twin-arginine translocase subunit TatC [Alphaproteobacteria bacterium]|nr:twin-arginine translocase subunit TatC [Alphaproteobacteria bacterium]